MHLNRAESLCSRLSSQDYSMASELLSLASLYTSDIKFEDPMSFEAAVRDIRSPNSDAIDAIKSEITRKIAQLEREISNYRDLDAKEQARCADERNI